MELGSTFGQLVTTNPTACAHLIGQLIDAFGADHVLWGTDSIWYGTPQWQIEAFRRFEIPQALVDKHGYAPLTREVKERIFGLNAARVFGVDVNAKRNEIPKDYLSRDEDGVSGRGRRPEPPLVRLGGGLSAAAAPAPAIRATRSLAPTPRSVMGAAGAGSAGSCPSPSWAARRGARSRAGTDGGRRGS